MVIQFDYKCDIVDLSISDFLYDNKFFSNSINETEHKYYIFNNLLSCNYDLLNKSKQVSFFASIESEGDISVRFAYYFLDEKKHKILSGLFAINSFVSLDVPRNTKYIRFGLKYHGSGNINLYNMKIFQGCFNDSSLRMLHLNDKSVLINKKIESNRNVQINDESKFFERSFIISDLRLLYGNLPIFIKGKFINQRDETEDVVDNVIRMVIYDEADTELSHYDLSLNTNYVLSIPQNGFLFRLFFVSEYLKSAISVCIESIYFSLFDNYSSNIYLSKKGDFVIRLLVKNFKSKCNGTVIFLSSLFDNHSLGKVNYPVYHRISWSDDLKDYCCIYVADPFAYLASTNKSKGSFYFDKEGNSTLFEICEILKKILGNNCGKLVVTGSSQGGYGAVLLGTIINADYILADCPQFIIDEHPDGLEYLKNKTQGSELRKISSVLNKFKPHCYIHVHFYNCDSNLNSFLKDYQKINKSLFEKLEFNAEIGDTFGSNSLGHKALNKSTALNLIVSYLFNYRNNINSSYAIKWEFAESQDGLVISSDFISVKKHSIISVNHTENLMISFYSADDKLIGKYECSRFHDSNSCLLLEGDKIKIFYKPCDFDIGKFNVTSSLICRSDISFFITRSLFKEQNYKLDDISLFLLPNLKSEKFDIVNIDKYVEYILEKKSLVLPNNKIVKSDQVLKYEPDSDQRSSQLWMYSLFWITPLSYMYMKDNDLEIKHIIKVQIKLFKDCYNQDPDMLKRVPSADHCCAIRFISLCNAYICLFDDPIANDIIGLLNDCIRYMTDTKNISFYNHGLMMISSLFNILKLIKQNENELLIRTIVMFCDKYLFLIYTSNTCSDGLFKENTIGYHNFNVKLFNNILDWIDKSSVHLPHSAYLKQRLKQSQLATRLCLFHDGCIPPIGDSPLMKTNIKPINKNYFFKEQNFVVLKDEQKYIFFKCGYLSKIHKHVDDSSFVLRNRGDDIVVDCGSYNYDLTDPIRQYCESFRGHNCCYPTMFESAMRINYLSKIHEESKIIEFNECEQFNETKCLLKLTSGFTLQRTIRDKKNCLVIYDNVETDTPQEISIRFNLSPKAKIIFYNSNFVFIQVGRTFAVFYSSSKMKIIKGFCSFVNFKYEENSVIQINERNISKSSYQTAIIYSDSISTVNQNIRLYLGDAFSGFEHLLKNVLDNVKT